MSCNNWIGRRIGCDGRPTSPLKNNRHEGPPSTVSTALAEPARAGLIQVAEDFQYEQPKTREFATFLEKVGAGRRVLVVVDERQENLELSTRNIPQVKLILASNINVRDVLMAETIIVTRAALAAITEHLG